MIAGLALMDLLGMTAQASRPAASARHAAPAAPAGAAPSPAPAPAAPSPPRYVGRLR